MSKISYHGAFVFRDQGNGILSGTFINPDSKMPFPETARLLNKSGSNLFEGTYDTVWLEIGISYNVSLEIKSTNNDTYDLTWTSASDPTKLNHQGLGFIEGDALVGCYWK